MISFFIPLLKSNYYNMKKLLLLLIAITTVSCNNTSEPAKVVEGAEAQTNAASDPNDFEELKSLEGKWAGTLERTDGSSDEFTLDYTVTSNGSAILEESDTGGTEMLSIFNFQNDELLLTHYCGLQNKPISKLTGNNNGVLSFATDSKMSGLTLEKDTYVTSWEINLLPEDDNQLMYKYTVSGPDGDVFTATSTLSRI
ncbi:MAG: hypothetical protein CMC29_05390 [Flavobacteriaceae bacterium]|nr:hypothetical protein [Flavobacteriaceae bacterium]